MQKYKSNLTSVSGAAVRGASVTVLDESGAVASIFLDRAGALPAGNPLKTGQDGTFEFYAANGRYSLRTDSSGLNVLEEDVIMMFDPEDGAESGPIADAAAALGDLETSDNLTPTAEWSEVPSVVNRALGATDPLNEQALANANRTALLRDNQKRTPMIFAALSEAQAAAATLPDRQLVDVESEQKRYRVQAGALVFVANFTRRDLSDASAGAAMVAFSIHQSIKQRLMGEGMTLKEFGAKCDRDTDDTQAVGDAVYEAVRAGSQRTRIIVDEGMCRVTQQIDVSGSVVFEGVASPRSHKSGYGSYGQGSFFYFDHLGKGLNFVNATDSQVKKIGTLRNQPEPSAGWTPLENDWDFCATSTTDFTVKDVLTINPTRAVAMMGPGRLNVYRHRGQAFKEGIRIHQAYDVCRLDQIHLWPFWADDPRVHAYTLQNLDAIYSLRNDNPMISNLFSIFARSGLRMGQNEFGGTSKLHLVNADLDRGSLGVWIDDTVTNGATCQLGNVTHQCETGMGVFGGGVGLLIDGNNSEVYFSSFSSVGAMANAARLNGTGNYVNFASASAKGYNASASGFPAFEATVGNTMEFATPPRTSGGGGAPKYGGTGVISSSEWRNFVPVITAQSGALGGISGVACMMRVVGETVSVRLSFTITDNGSAAGAIHVNLPVGSLKTRVIGGGREVAATGKALSVSSAGPVYAQILTADNAYPAGNGYVFDVAFEYTANF